MEGPDVMQNADGLGESYGDGAEVVRMKMINAAWPHSQQTNLHGRSSRSIQ